MSFSSLHRCAAKSFSPQGSRPNLDLTSHCLSDRYRNYHQPLICLEGPRRRQTHSFSSRSSAAAKIAKCEKTGQTRGTIDRSIGADVATKLIARIAESSIANFASLRCCFSPS